MEVHALKNRTLRQSVWYYLRLSLSLCAVTVPATAIGFVVAD